MKAEVIEGDNLIEMPRLIERGVSVDACVTDPPYGVNKAEWDGEFPTAWIQPARKLAPRMLVMTGNSALIQAGAAFGDEYRDCISLYALNGMTRSKIAFGNWIPVIATGDWKWEARPNLIKFIVDTSEYIDHPSPKPLEAMVKLLDYYTKPGWTVLDPFAGSGQIGVACAILGRDYVGIERDPFSAELARARITKAQGIPADIPRRARVEPVLPLFAAAI